MSGSLPLGNPASIPILAPSNEANTIGTLLSNRGQALQNQQNYNQLQQYNSTKAANGIYEQNLNPDGSLDMVGFTKAMRANPMTALMSPQSVATAIANNKAQVGLASDTAGLQTTYAGISSNILSGLANQKLSGPEAQAEYATQALERGLPAGVVSQAVQQIGDSEDPDTTQNNLMGLARTQTDAAAQAGALAPKLAGSISTGGGITPLVQGGAGGPIVPAQTQQMTLPPQITNGVNQQTGTPGPVVVQQAPPQLPGNAMQPVTTPASQVPYGGPGSMPQALQGPGGEQVASGGGVQAPPGGSTPVAAPGGVAVTPTGIASAINPSIQHYVETVQPTVDSWSSTQANAPAELRTLTELQQTLGSGSVSTGPMASVLQKLRGTVAEFTGLSAKEASNYDLSAKLMSQIGLQMPQGIGTATDFKLQQHDAANANMSNTNQGNDNVVANAIGSVRAAQLSAELAAKSGLMGALYTPDAQGNPKLQDFIENVNGAISPMAAAYDAMSPANQANFRENLPKSERADFVRDVNIYKALQPGVIDDPKNAIGQAFLNGDWQDLQKLAEPQDGGQ